MSYPGLVADTIKFRGHNGDTGDAYYARPTAPGKVPGVVLIHTLFGMPVMTLLFRNYYASVPHELFMAARIDGGGFWRIFVQLMLPMSLPIVVVAVIMQVTAIWNDFLVGLVFAGHDWLPMTVQLNNIINTTTGERLYDVNMAATILTSLVPLVIYLVSGRWFVRGITAGSVKGSSAPRKDSTAGRGWSNGSSRLSGMPASCRRQ